MRIITQHRVNKEQSDIPYEQFVLCTLFDFVTGGNYIMAQPITGAIESIPLGWYKEKQRALKVMEQIRKQYNKIKEAELNSCKEDYYYDVSYCYQMPEE